MERRGEFSELISWFLVSETSGKKGLKGRRENKGTMVTSVTEGTSGPWVQLGRSLFCRTEPGPYTLDSRGQSSGTKHVGLDVRADSQTEAGHLPSPGTCLF